MRVEPGRVGRRPWVLLLVLPLWLSAPAPARAREDRDLRRQQTFRIMLASTSALPEEVELPAFRGPFAADPAPPPCLGEPLDPRFLRLGEELSAPSKADWQRRLRDHGGLASLVPLSALDPSRELLVLCPGIGMNFQDLHALRLLEDSYQVLVLVSDQARPLLDNGRQAAAALAGFMRYWQELARARGLAPSRRLRLLGHSFGGGIAHAALVELAEQELLGEGPEALLERVLLVGVDGPWRGVDLPWMLTLPVVKQVGSVLVPLLPVKRDLRRGSLSLANRTRSMKRLTREPPPDHVVTRLATVLGGLSTSPRFRHFEPVANWYTAELGTGELERLWRFYREGGTDPGALEFWSTPGITRRRGLRNLVFFLARDEDYPAIHPELVTAARESADALAFGRRWDGRVREVVDTFEGTHTEFMWEDPRFMPWLRGALTDF